jgi:hypothetical protein
MFACVALSMLCCRYAAAKDWASMLITINSIPFHLEKKMGKRGQVAGKNFIGRDLFLF